jgi:hypothetical protein
MKTYLTEEFNCDRCGPRAAFGSVVVRAAAAGQNGGKLTEFDSTLTDRHPRSAIDNYAPGHYCFVVVERPASVYSVRHAADGTFRAVRSLGCKQAYNHRRRRDRNHDVFRAA